MEIDDSAPVNGYSLRQRFTKDKNDKFEEVKSKKQLKKDKKAAAAVAAKVNTNA